MRFSAIVAAAAWAQLTLSAAVPASEYVPSIAGRAEKLAGYYFVYFNGRCHGRIDGLPIADRV